MQDNAPAHRAQITQEFLNTNMVNMLDWPSVSPDLNPIEHLWDKIKKRLRKITPKPRSSDELWEQVLLIWNQLTEDDISPFTGSMRRRVNSVIGSDGGHTRY